MPQRPRFIYRQGMLSLLSMALPLIWPGVAQAAVTPQTLQQAFEASDQERLIPLQCESSTTPSHWRIHQVEILDQHVYQVVNNFQSREDVAWVKARLKMKSATGTDCESIYYLKYRLDDPAAGDLPVASRHPQVKRWRFGLDQPPKNSQEVLEALQKRLAILAPTLQHHAHWQWTDAQHVELTVPFYTAVPEAFIEHLLEQHAFRLKTPAVQGQWQDSGIHAQDFVDLRLVRDFNILDTFALEFKMTPTGQNKLATLTRQLHNQPLGIFLNDQLLMAPVIQEPIVAGAGIISGIENDDKLMNIHRALLLSQLPLPALALKTQDITQYPVSIQDLVAQDPERMTALNRPFNDAEQAVKANMYTLQTALETYAIDHGQYPHTLKELQAAGAGEYWKDLMNPYTQGQGIGNAVIEQGQAKPGQVSYEVAQDHRSYRLAGAGENGPLLIKGKVFVLSNSL